MKMLTHQTHPAGSPEAKAVREAWQWALWLFMTVVMMLVPFGFWLSPQLDPTQPDAATVAQARAASYTQNHVAGSVFDATRTPAASDVQTLQAASMQGQARR